MTSPSNAAIREQAERWTIRVQDPDFSAWDALADWLEQDPAHLGAYEAAIAADARIAALFDTPEPPIVRELLAPKHPRWRRIGAGGAIAAGIALLIGYAALDRGSPPYAIETATGARRTIALTDGSRIEVNGASRIVLDEDEPRYARLERGEALFHIRHDAGDPFVVDAGPARLVDAGTVFNVVRERGVTRVAVSEGAVIYNPSAEKVRLDAGERLRAADDATEVIVGAIEPAMVGSWRHGVLSWSDAALGEVAADLSRNLGVPVRTAPGIERRRFTGTLAISGAPDAVLARAAPLLGVEARRTGAGWTLAAMDRANP